MNQEFERYLGVGAGIFLFISGQALIYPRCGAVVQSDCPDWTLREKPRALPWSASGDFS